MNFVEIQEGHYVAPNIKAIDDCFDACQDIVNTISQYEWQQVDHGTDESRNIEYVEIKVDYSTDPLIYALIQQMYLQGRKYAEETGAQFTTMDHVKFYKFPPKTGYTDIGSESTPIDQKEFCVAVNLNTVDGGEMLFHDFDLGFKPISGSMVVFPANFAYKHSENAPENQNKYMAVGWFK